MVKIGELVLNGNGIPLQKRYLETNGKTIKSGCYVFETSDPNIVIKVSELPMAGENTLTVKMEVSPISTELAQDVAGAVKKWF